MPRPIAKSQFSNDILVSGEGKPLTEHQETHLMERHAYRVNGIAMNEKGLGRLVGFIAVGMVTDWWRPRSYEHHETPGRVRIGGDKII